MSTKPAPYGLEAQEQLVSALQKAAAYPHATERIRLLETHISYVLLTGAYAYKIKKAVSFGFLDFTTLARRRFYCEEELRLNRRLAPGLYLEVVPIGGTSLEPQLGALDGIFDYAVKMREFPQEDLLNRVLARGALTAQQLDAIAMLVAGFHRRIERARPDQPWGSVASIEQPMRENFSQIAVLLATPTERQALETLEAWSLREHEQLLPVFAQRHDQGLVRECHGDLHLGNIALVDNEIQIFDCIEFNPNLRWIDVISEIAFLVMDLEERGRPDYSARLLNAYLQETGDYAGLRVLRYYQVYRAMVRAKVARMRAGQPHLDPDERWSALAAYDVYIGYALRVISPQRPALLITHGLSGSGKTTVSQALLERLRAVRVRSDVERKRLHELSPLAESRSGLGSGIYVESATRSTYGELFRLARVIVRSDHFAILDAAFLRRWQRDRARQLAAELGVRFVIASCHASEPELRRRLAYRADAGGDGSEATPEVLDRQLASADPLGEEERPFVVIVDTEGESAEAMKQKILSVL